MAHPTPITVAYGDGIGPEIMEATLEIIKEAGANLQIDTIEVGERVYNMGASSGILPSAWETLEKNKVLLKAPITTPQGKGYKSLNVTLRKTLGLFANIRPVACYHPFVKSLHPKMDMVIVRENEEDLYSGVEHRHTQDSVQCLKLITRSGSERIMRHAFEYATLHNRQKVTCMSKDNIMKMTDGLFHRTYDEVAKEYPKIETEHFIIDIGSARIASRPDHFDVIVTENLYGDIISDIAAEVSGSVGLAGSANIGEQFAMFEAIHGSAPDITGKGIANPSGLLQSAVMMLVHIGQPEVANIVQNAWSKTIEDGIHTGDIYWEKSSKKASTKEFAAAVIERLGKKPSQLPVSDCKKVESKARKVSIHDYVKVNKTLVGADIFVDWNDSPDALGEKISACVIDALPLQMISTKGLKVWPDMPPSHTNLSDHFCCRFTAEKEIDHVDIVTLLQALRSKELDFIKVENLYQFDNQRGYSLGQGE